MLCADLLLLLSSLAVGKEWNKPNIPKSNLDVENCPDPNGPLYGATALQDAAPYPNPSLW